MNTPCPHPVWNCVGYRPSLYDPGPQTHRYYECASCGAERTDEYDFASRAWRRGAPVPPRHRRIGEWVPHEHPVDGARLVHRHASTYTEHAHINTVRCETTGYLYAGAGWSELP